MPDYKCECCNYSTKIKTHYQRHLKSKKHQKLNKDNGVKKSDLHISPHFSTFSPHFSTFSPHFSTFFQNAKSDLTKPKKFICVHCNKSFARSDSLTRHINESCKKKKMQEDIKEKKVDRQYNELLNLLEKERVDHKEQMDKILDKVGNTTINNQTNNLTQTNNVQVNNYGSENLEMLTDTFMKKMISFPYTAIPKMIKKIHFNDNYPENKNIRMLNKRDGKLQILQKNKWIYVDKKEQMLRLIDDKNYILDKYYEDNKRDFNQNLQHRFDKFQFKYSLNDKFIKSENNKETELVFWNSM
tara:strand:- start:727 stop:1623 length:897 start_codon:yes stop_codon:yes gene_type:complete